MKKLFIALVTFMLLALILLPVFSGNRQAWNKMDTQNAIFQVWVGTYVFCPDLNVYASSQVYTPKIIIYGGLGLIKVSSITFMNGDPVGGTATSIASGNYFNDVKVSSALYSNDSDKLDGQHGNYYGTAAQDILIGQTTGQLANQDILLGQATGQAEISIKTKLNDATNVIVSSHVAPGAITESKITPYKTSLSTGTMGQVNESQIVPFKVSLATGAVGELPYNISATTGLAYPSASTGQVWAWCGSSYSWVTQPNTSVWETQLSSYIAPKTANTNIMPNGRMELGSPTTGLANIYIDGSGGNGTSGLINWGIINSSDTIIKLYRWGGQNLIMNGGINYTFPSGVNSSVAVGSLGTGNLQFTIGGWCGSSGINSLALYTGQTGGHLIEPNNTGGTLDGLHFHKGDYAAWSDYDTLWADSYGNRYGGKYGRDGSDGYMGSLSIIMPYTYDTLNITGGGQNYVRFYNDFSVTRTLIPFTTAQDLGTGVALPTGVTEGATNKYRDGFIWRKLVVNEAPVYFSTSNVPAIDGNVYAGTSRAFDGDYMAWHGSSWSIAGKYSEISPLGVLTYSPTKKWRLKVDDTGNITTSETMCLNISTPNSSVLWGAGLSEYVEWSSTEIPFVDVDISTCSGVVWTNIATNIVNIDSTTIIVPTTISTGVYNVVRVKNHYGTEYALSDSMFTIAKFPHNGTLGIINYVTPTYDESYSITEIYGPFTATEDGTATGVYGYFGSWANQGVSVKMQLYTKSGTTFNYISGTYSGVFTVTTSGWYSYPITTSLVSGTDYYIGFNFGNDGELQVSKSGTANHYHEGRSWANFQNYNYTEATLVNTTGVTMYIAYTSN